MFVIYSSLHPSMLTRLSGSGLSEYGNYISAASFDLPVKQRYDQGKIETIFTIYNFKPFSTFIIPLQVLMFKQVNR